MSLRERINSDPKLQIGLGVILVLVVGFLLLGQGGGESEEGGGEEAATGAVEGAPLGVEAAAVTEGSLASVAGALPPPPLPAKQAKAYQAGDVVVLLVVREGGIDDKLVAKYTRLVHSAAGSVDGHPVALSVVSVKKIAKYGALTLGLDVQRVPALIVLRPKKLSRGGLEGSVLYGYQTPSSIYQALIDATYRGPDGSYHPG